MKLGTISPPVLYKLIQRCVLGLVLFRDDFTSDLPLGTHVSFIFYVSFIIYSSVYQRWSPRGHILKSLALASKPQVLENCPVLSSRTALFFEPLNFCWKALEILRKIRKTLFSFPLLEIA